MNNVKIVLVLMALGVCAPSWLHAAEPLPLIKGIRVFRTADNLGVEINADKNFEYTCTKMPQLRKVVIDMPRTEFSGTDTVYKYKSSIISHIWLEKKTINDVLITRVSVHLTEDADFVTRRDPLDGRKMTVYLSKSAVPAGDATAVKPGNGKPGSEPAAAKLSAPVTAAAKAAPKLAVGSPGPLSGAPISITGIHCSPDSIEITAGGDIGAFKAFPLRQPGRLVIDVPGAQTSLRPIALPANIFGAAKARFGLSEGGVRIVLDAGGLDFPDCEVVKTTAGLRVVMRARGAARN